MNRPRVNYRNIDKIQSNRIASGLTNSGDLAKKVSGSGSRWYAKGDAISKMFLVEAKDKSAPAKQRTIHRDVFDKLRLEAIGERKIPLYVVGFGDGQDFMILNDLDFYALIERLLLAEKKVAELTNQ
ncbi:hypothetical protein [Bacillus pumilus]|uniref:hypothetical protein n=1 Tax=Bacillus pumilus TaxID=1408 RepID=UPI0011E92811|nr:hypothetical protein [Bacillus pumilus]TYS40492.1 hypothetical protein FZC68_16925 [Bacillus pumilus]